MGRRWISKEYWVSMWWATALLRQGDFHIVRRRIWRAPSKPKLHWDPIVSFINMIAWLRAAHDCQDPSIGCSCSGGYRFPKVGSDG